MQSAKFLLTLLLVLLSVAPVAHLLGPAPPPSIVFGKHIDKSQVGLGDTFTITLTLENGNTGSSSWCEVEDPNPSSTYLEIVDYYQDPVAGKLSLQDGTIEWTGRVFRGSTQKVIVKMRVIDAPTNPQVVTNVATVQIDIYYTERATASVRIGNRSYLPLITHRYAP